MIPVLCYHSWTIGDQYNNDDHIALEQDLQLLSQRGYLILPVEKLIDLKRGRLPKSYVTQNKLVCISFDDGKAYDYIDGERPDGSIIKSFARILRECSETLPTLLPGTRAASFVIGSAEARSMIWNDSPQLTSDDWWLECADEGTLGLANHSWDHVHENVETVYQQNNIKGSFHEIRTFEDAEAQIAKTQDLLNEKLQGNHLPVFCYPFGHVSEYLKTEYLPQNSDRLGIFGAFSTAGKAVTENTDIWAIPRFVCGYHWRTPEQLANVLTEIERGCNPIIEPNTKPPTENLHPIDGTSTPPTTTASHSDRQKPDVTLDDIFVVLETNKADFIIGDLFRRRFNTDSFPQDPLHYVAFIKLPDGSFVSMGYVHYTLWNGCALCGGLVSENRPSREIPDYIWSLIWDNGGIAELLFKESFKCLPKDTTAVWAHVGNPRSEIVCKSVGFERTMDQYVMAAWWDESLNTNERDDLIQKVVQLGPF